MREAIDAALEVSEVDLDLVMKIDSIAAGDGGREKALSEYEKAMDVNGEFIRRNRQLMLRLHRHDLIVKALEEYRTELFQALRDLRKIIEGDISYDKDAWDVRFEKIAQLHANAIDAATNRLGSTLADRKD